MLVHQRWQRSCDRDLLKRSKDRSSFHRRHRQRHNVGAARPVDPEWALDIRDQCRDADVPFFFKQWGGVRKKKAGRVLEGRTWDDMALAEMAAL